MLTLKVPNKCCSRILQFVICCIFSKMSSKISVKNTIRVSISLDPGQAQAFVRPDLGPNCLKWLSADDTSKQGFNSDLWVEGRGRGEKICNALTLRFTASYNPQN